VDIGKSVEKRLGKHLPGEASTREKHDLVGAVVALNLKFPKTRPGIGKALFNHNIILAGRRWIVGFECIAWTTRSDLSADI